MKNDDPEARAGGQSQPPAPDDHEFDEALEALQDEALRQAREVYSSEVIAECLAPHNIGRLEPCDGAAALTGGCGDTMEITLRVREEIVTEAAFLTNGCGATVACGSAVTRLAQGRRIEEALNITQQEILTVLNGLPESHRHCAALAAETLLKALTDSLEKNGAPMRRDP